MARAGVPAGRSVRRQVDRRARALGQRDRAARRPGGAPAVQRRAPASPARPTCPGRPRRPPSAAARPRPGARTTTSAAASSAAMRAASARSSSARRRARAAGLRLVPGELLERGALVEDPALAQRRPQLVAGPRDRRREPRPLRVVPRRLLSGAVGERAQRGRVGPQAVPRAPVERLLARRVGPLAAQRGVLPRPALGEVLLGRVGPPPGPARPPPSSRGRRRSRRRGPRRAACPSRRPVARRMARTATTTAASSDTTTGRMTIALKTSAASRPKYSAASPTPTPRMVSASALSRPAALPDRRPPAIGAAARIRS